MKNIKNIIFDLGGVLINLDPDRTRRCFQSFFPSKDQYETFYQKMTKESIFNDHETGKISDDFFIETIQRLVPKKISNYDIVNAWNAMILDFPRERIELLRRLRKRFNIFVLSNTNHIHLQLARQRALLDAGINDLDAEFDQAFYSHILHERKPGKRIYELVCQHANINPSETCFIDDNMINLTGAEQIGICTIKHTANSDLEASLAPILTF